MNIDDGGLRTKLEDLHPASYGWALCCCSYDHEQALDVLQNVYIKILENKASFDGKAHFRTWLFSVIRITALNARRKRLLQKLGLARYENQPTAEVTRPDPVQATELKQQQAVVRKALAALPGRQREVLHLVFYQDLTLEEAAAAIGVSTGSARTHYDRGKKKLRALLEQSRHWL